MWRKGERWTFVMHGLGFVGIGASFLLGFWLVDDAARGFYGVMGAAFMSGGLGYVAFALWPRRVRPDAGGAGPRRGSSR